MGPDYAHAEARKSPALDGKVERDKDGKEIRYPVLLSAKEKLIARKICLAFKVGLLTWDICLIYLIFDILDIHHLNRCPTVILILLAPIKGRLAKFEHLMVRN